MESVASAAEMTGPLDTSLLCGETPRGNTAGEGRHHHLMDSSSTSCGSYELADYGALLRRRWQVIALGVALGLIFSLLYTLFWPRTYTSTTSVLVSPTRDEQIDLANGRTSTSINLDTEAQIVTSAVVASRVQKRLGISTPTEEMLEDVRVSVPPSTSVLSVSYDAKDAAAAKRGSHAFAVAYLHHRSDAAHADIKNRIKGIRQQIADLRNQLKKWSDQAAALPEGSSDQEYASTRRTVVLNRIGTLNEELGPLRGAHVTPGTIITDAELPEAPTHPSRSSP